jgi:FlaG/FlaF family flagellin (archaellin)
MRSRKEAVTPVIATIILIAGTLVLALVVGAYTFGLFGSNVKTVTLSSGTLYGGVSADPVTTATASLTLSLNNPGSATVITGITLTGAGITSVTGWDTASIPSAAPTLQFTGYTAGSPNAMGPGAVSSFTFYPWAATSQNILTGQTFNYVINFANGQSVSGSLIAQ